jgi:hypothetical protein
MQVCESLRVNFRKISGTVYGTRAKSPFMELFELGFIMDQLVWKLDFSNNFGGNL